MKYDVYLIEVLKDQLEDFFVDEYGFDDDEIDQLYRDKDGLYYQSDKDFIEAFKKDIFTNIIMGSIYNFITKLSLLSEKNTMELVSFLFAHFYANHYKNEEERVYLRQIASYDIKAIVEMFYQNERFGIDLITSFYNDVIKPEEYERKKDALFEDGNDDLEKFYEIAFPEKLYTLNQKLREIICNLYNHYISTGYQDEVALELTWCYFFNDVDPFDELSDLGIDKNNQLTYKSIMLGLIISDLYEDALNTPIVNTDNPSGMVAQYLPILYASIGRIDIPNDKDVRNRMLKYFILLQSDSDKMKSNRQKTHELNKVEVLKRVNPLYFLDELK